MLSLSSHLFITGITIFGCTGQGSYNFANMGLSTTCDFEWSMCGWTQETAPTDQLDFKRQRGPNNPTSYYKIPGDHTAGKDGFGFYVYLDGADYRRPILDPEVLDSIEHPEPDELLAQQMGIASSLRQRRPFMGPLNKPPKFSGRNTLLNRLPRMAPGSSYSPYSPNSYPNYRAPHGVQAGSSYSRYPDHSFDQYLAQNHYGAQNHGAQQQQPATYRKTSVDTNSDVKPYDLPGYTGSPTGGVPSNVPTGTLLPPGMRNINQQPIAILVGPRVETPINLTFKFWYHMRGNNVGRLTLYRKVLARPDQIIWEKTGHQSFDWTEGQVHLEKGSFQLRFESTVIPRGNPAEGYIGLDDLWLEKEADLPMLMNSAFWTTTVPPSVQLLYQHHDLPASSLFLTTSTAKPETTTPPLSLNLHKELLETLARLPSLMREQLNSAQAPATTTSTTPTTERPVISTTSASVQSTVSTTGMPYTKTTTVKAITTVRSSLKPTTKNGWTDVFNGIVNETQNFVKQYNWTKMQGRMIDYGPVSKAPLRKPVMVALPHDEAAAIGDQAELSAVIHDPAHLSNKTSTIYLSVLSCLGVASLIIIVVIIVKRNKRRVVDFFPTTRKRRGPAHRMVKVETSRTQLNPVFNPQSRRLPVPPPPPERPSTV